MTTGANPGLIKNYDAGAAIAKYRIVKFGTSDYTVIQAAAATDLLIGVSNLLGADSGDRVDVVKSGIAQVEYGGNVTRGALLTADADGKAVAAAPAAGANASVIGYAEVSGVSGDIGAVFIAPGSLQTAD